MEKVRVCNVCKRGILRIILNQYFLICPYCGYYMRLHEKKRLRMLADSSWFYKWDLYIKLSDSQMDEFYQKKLHIESTKKKLGDAIIMVEIRTGRVHGVMDIRFMMASMIMLLDKRLHDCSKEQ